MPVLGLLLLLHPVRRGRPELLLVLPKRRLLELRMLRWPLLLLLLLLLLLHGPRLSVRLHPASARLPSRLSEGLETASAAGGSGTGRRRRGGTLRRGIVGLRRQIDGARRSYRQLRRRCLRAAHAILAA